MKRLVLIGGGGFAKEVFEIAELTGFEVVGYVADGGEGVIDLPYLGGIEQLDALRARFDEVVIAFGAVDRKSVARRSAVIASLAAQHFAFATMVSPRAVVSRGATLGQGSVVAHGVVVSVDAAIGEHVVLNTSAIIGHDAVIGERTMIAPGAFVGGAASIGADCLIGPNSIVLQGRRVGDESIVSLGGSVLRHLPAGRTVLPHSSRVID